MAGRREGCLKPGDLPCSASGNGRVPSSPRRPRKQSPPCEGAPGLPCTRGGQQAGGTALAWEQRPRGGALVPFSFQRALKTSSKAIPVGVVPASFHFGLREVLHLSLVTRRVFVSWEPSLNDALGSAEPSSCLEVLVPGSAEIAGVWGAIEPPRSFRGPEPPGTSLWPTQAPGGSLRCVESSGCRA